MSPFSSKIPELRKPNIRGNAFNSMQDHLHKRLHVSMNIVCLEKDNQILKNVEN